VDDFVSLLMIGALLLFAAALALFAFQIRRTAAERLAADERRNALDENRMRIDLLDRRRALCVRIDALWLCWARCERPGRDLLADAAAAAEEARMLFPAELGPDLDEVAGLLAAATRHQSWQEAAIDHRRHEERIALLEQEEQMMRSLKPKIAGLRALLVEAGRPGCAG
jgi:hypothetical protein